MSLSKVTLITCTVKIKQPSWNPKTPHPTQQSMPFSARKILHTAIKKSQEIILSKSSLILWQLLESVQASFSQKSSKLSSHLFRPTGKSPHSWPLSQCLTDAGQLLSIRLPLPGFTNTQETGCRVSQLSLWPLKHQTHQWTGNKLLLLRIQRLKVPWSWWRFPSPNQMGLWHHCQNSLLHL